MTQMVKKWWVLGAMIFATSMIFIDITVLPVALPTIQRELNLSELGLQWLINSYLLTLTVSLIAAGKLGDILGHRKIYNMGLILFAMASAFCGFSHSELELVISRALQGIGGAFILPSIGPTLISVFPPNQRGKAMGLNVSAGSVFLSIGPFVGGVFAQYFTWHYIFWINLPIAAIGLLLSFLFVPKTEGHQQKFDLKGFLTLVLGITSFVVAFMQSAVWGWGSWLTLGLICLGVLLIGALVAIDRNTPHPFVDFSLFKKKSFYGSVLCIFCVGFLLMVTVFWVIYFQDVMGYSPTAAGAIALISNSPIIAISPLAGHLTDRFGPRRPASYGFALILFGLIWFLLFASGHNLLWLLPALITFGCGIPLVFNPCFVTPLSEVIPQKRGMASGITMTIRQMSGAMGMAILGTVFIQRQQSLFDQALQQNSDTLQTSPACFDGLLSFAPEAMESLQNFSTSTAIYIKTAYLEAYMAAFQNINLVATLTACVGFYFALALLKKSSSRT